MARCNRWRPGGVSRNGVDDRGVLIGDWLRLISSGKPYRPDAERNVGMFLQRPFSTIIAGLTDVTFHPYYTGPFEHFEESLAQTSAWDIEATVAILPVVNDVLEVGCGRGRVTIALAKAGFRVAGVDSSLAAISEFRSRLDRDCYAGAIEVRHCDFLNDDSITRRFPAVLLSNLTINLFQSDQIDALLGRIRAALTADGCLCFGVLTEPGLAKFARYDGTARGSVHAQAYKDEQGRERLMWTLTVFNKETATIRQDWFVDLEGSAIWPGRYHVSSLKEKLWTLDELRPSLCRRNLKVEHRIGAAIEGGGAVGAGVEFIRARVNA